MTTTEDLLMQLEDAISNIDYPGSDAPYWEAKAKGLAREQAARIERVLAIIDRDVEALANLDPWELKTALWVTAADLHEMADGAGHAGRYAEADALYERARGMERPTDTEGDK